MMRLNKFYKKKTKFVVKKIFILHFFEEKILTIKNIIKILYFIVRFVITTDAASTQFI